MNEPTDPRPDDELLSDVLDGIASAAQVDRVMGDPALAARLAELRAGADLLRAPVEPLAPEVVDDLVTRALGHYGETADPIEAHAIETGDGDHTRWTGELPSWSEHAGPARPADQIAARRERRERAWRVPPLAAAAVLLLVAGLGLFVALQARSDRNRRPTTNAAQLPTELAPGTQYGAGSGAADSGRGGQAAPLTAAGGLWLGAYADQAGLTKALTTLDARTLLPAAQTTSGEGSPTGGSATSGSAPTTTYVPDPTEITRCDNVIRLGVKRALTNRLAVAGAQLGGRDVLVVSYEAPATTTKPAGAVIAVADRVSCYLVLEQDH
jgi:hypothetical protein